VAAWCEVGPRGREDLFLQTKFTSLGGQDHRLPFDADADPATQVRQSFASSLEHLRTTYVDSYVLHGPSSRRGLTDEDWEVWRAMETLHQGGQARRLGVSNVSLEQLATLHGGSAVNPVFVQNRCFAVNGWDHGVRAFCREHGIVYQGFSLLTANTQVFGSSAVVQAARRTGRTPAQVVFRFALQVGMLPLTGTTSPVHMKEGLEDFELAGRGAGHRDVAVAGDEGVALAGWYCAGQIARASHGDVLNRPVERAADLPPDPAPDRLQIALGASTRRLPRCVAANLR
jgi:diketogulonate reductase-like aldo/keto reductase